jgi:hypothetical protein
MDASAIVLMLIGMVIIWGGLIVGIVHAIRVGRHREGGDTGF